MSLLSRLMTGGGEGGGEDPKKPAAKGEAEKMFPAMKGTFAKYIKSPLYMERLKRMGIENPEEVVKQRLQSVGSAEAIPSGTDKATWGFWDTKQKNQTIRIELSKDASLPTAMHELSHSTNSQEKAFKTPTQASGGSMSAKEMLYMAVKQKNKGLAGQILDRYKANENLGIYTNPASGMEGDAHTMNPEELKSDIDALRYMLNKAGITKSFGDNITPEEIEKAKRHPEISSDSHFQRLLKVYNEQAIVDINNKVAAP